MAVLGPLKNFRMISAFTKALITDKLRVSSKRNHGERGEEECPPTICEELFGWNVVQCVVTCN